MSATQSLRPCLLLAEDEVVIRLDIENALEDAGFDVMGVASGAAAIEKLTGSALSGLITDIRLGDAVSGWDIARRAREVHPAIPVLYMSGDSAADWSSQGVPHSLMIPKPFAMAQLVTAISQLMNAAGGIASASQ